MEFPSERRDPQISSWALRRIAQFQEISWLGYIKRIGRLFRHGGRPVLDWLLSFLPVPEPYKTLIRGTILFAVILFILYAAFAYMPNFSFPVQRRY